MSMTPDQASDFIAKMDSGYYGNVVASQKVSEAFRDVQSMIEEYQSVLSDILYYRMLRCVHCNHFTMADEIVCHVCGRPLPTADAETNNEME